MNTPSAVEADGLTEHYGALTAVDAIVVRVEQGEVYGILGRMRQRPQRLGADRCVFTLPGGEDRHFLDPSHRTWMIWVLVQPARR